MSISAIVLSYNSERHLAACVRSLVAALAPLPGPHEIRVIDNGSKDRSPVILRELLDEYPHLVVPVWLPRNTGTTVSRNLALREARGDWLLVIDSDATADADAIATLVHHLETHPDCGLAAPRLTYPDGRFQLSTDRFPTIGRKLQRLLWLRDLERDAPVPAQPVDVDYAISAFWLLRRAAVQQVGLLDERIFYSPEDVDYCLRLWSAGWRVTYVPAACAIHDAQELSRGRKLNAFFLRHAAGLAYFHLKHRYALGLGRLYARIGRRAQPASALPSTAADH